jgi:hypothetical protein
MRDNIHLESNRWERDMARWEEEMDRYKEDGPRLLLFWALAVPMVWIALGYGIRWWVLS